MPRATFVGKPGLWDKLKGVQPRHALATMWKLVEYDAAPAVDAVPETGRTSSDDVAGDTAGKG